MQEDESLSDYDRDRVTSIIKDVAEERGVDIVSEDPLISLTLEARDELGNTIEKLSESRKAE